MRISSKYVEYTHCDGPTKHDDQEDAENEVDSAGFWREFFLLKPDKARLQQRLESLRADDLLQLQVLSSNPGLGTLKGN